MTIQEEACKMLPYSIPRTYESDMDRMMGGKKISVKRGKGDRKKREKVNKIMEEEYKMLS